MKKEKQKIVAVVVTYNRKRLLKECIEALRKQTKPIDAIYLIDNNSSDGTPELLKEEGYIQEIPPKDLTKPWEKEFITSNLTTRNKIKIHYVRMHKNTGGSGEFYEGLKRGFEKAYDWVWLMDDDAEPKEDALEKLNKYFEESNVSALASVVYDTDEISLTHRCFIDFRERIFPFMLKPVPIESYSNTVVEIDVASFVGILLSSKIIKKVGYPKKEFFFHCDDWEYCFRLRQAGRILLVTDSIFFHKEEDRRFIKKYFLREVKQRGSYDKYWLANHFLGKTRRWGSYDKYWLIYYGVRNLIWLGKL